MGRYFIGALVGAVVTIALGYLMQALIFADSDLVLEAPDYGVITITRDIIDEGPDEPDHPVRPTAADQPPPLPPMPQPQGPNENPGTYTLPTPEPTGPTTGPLTIPTVLMPLVRVAPDYPRSALQRGIEGFAIVGFSVGPDGSTQDQRILSSEPGTTFDNAALNAVSAWIYQPQTDSEGRPVTVGGQSARFDFDVSDGSQE